jgi:hypothetical protein
MFSLPTFDPTFYTALHSLDFGSVQSPDGRDHYLDANTPVSVISAPIPDVVGAGSLAPPVGSFIPNPYDVTGVKQGAPFFTIPKHFGARVAVGVLAIGILLVVVLRLTK